MDPSTICRARLARAVRVGERPEAVEDLRRDYHAAKLRDQVVTWLASTPVPSSVHRAELAALLLEGIAAHAVA